MRQRKGSEWELKRETIVILLLLLLVVGVNSQSQTGEIELIFEDGVNGYEGTKDSSIYAESNNTNGAGMGIFAGNTRVGLARRGLLQFDLSAIPEGATINSVSLQLKVSRTIVGASDQSLHLLLSDWGEGERDPEGEEGTGITPHEGNVTWNSNFHNQSSWDTAGGDYVESASAIASIEATNFVAEWTGDDLVSDVQSWINGDSENFGWILIGDETSSPSAKRYSSSNDSRADEGEKPRLVIRYTPAE
jgi:hypothetical protein